MELPHDHPAIVIFDAFRGHNGEEVQTLLAENHFLAVKVQNNCNDWLQPLDLSVNKAVKDRQGTCTPLPAGMLPKSPFRLSQGRASKTCG